MNSDTSFAELVKGRRTELGLSQASLAELVGRSSSAIRSWERGASTPTDENVVRSLAAVLGIDEVTLRSAVGLPPEAPIEAPEEVGGSALEAFEEETVGGDKEEEEAVEPETAGGDEVSSEEDEEASVFEETTPGPAEDEEAVTLDEAVPQAGDDAEVDAGAQATEVDEVEEAPETDAILISPPLEVPTPTMEPMMPAAASQASPTATIPVAAPPTQPIRPSYLDDPDQMMTYWIRAAMTVAFAVFLLIVFFWALGRLGDAIGEVWEIFKAGA
jgi:transcriptional regulator with XRE-family HTH domain